MAEPGLFPSFFFADRKPGEPGSYEALVARRKIAESLLGKRSPYPKNIGEGIASLGESIGDTLLLRDLDERSRAQSLYEDRVMNPPGGAGRSYIPGTGGPPPVVGGPPPVEPPPAAAGRTISVAPPTVSPDPAAMERGAAEGLTGPRGETVPIYEPTDITPEDRRLIEGRNAPAIPFRTERNDEVGRYVGFDRAYNRIDPQLRERLALAYNAMPPGIAGKFALNEGWRPYEYQAYLRHLRDTGARGGMAARPGTSMHEGETAKAVDVDVNEARNWLARNAAAYGLYNLPGDPGHFQLAPGWRRPPATTGRDAITRAMPGMGSGPEGDGSAMPYLPGRRSDAAEPDPLTAMAFAPADLDRALDTPDAPAGAVAGPAELPRVTELTTNDPNARAIAGAGQDAVDVANRIPAMPPGVPPEVPGRVGGIGAAAFNAGRAAGGMPAMPAPVAPNPPTPTPIAPMPAGANPQLAGMLDPTPLHAAARAPDFNLLPQYAPAPAPAAALAAAPPAAGPPIAAGGATGTVGAGGPGPATPQPENAPATVLGAAGTIPPGIERAPSEALPPGAPGWLSGARVGTAGFPTGPAAGATSPLPATAAVPPSPAGPRTGDALPATRIAQAPPAGTLLPSQEPIPPPGIPDIPPEVKRTPRPAPLGPSPVAQYYMRVMNMRGIDEFTRERAKLMVEREERARQEEEKRRENDYEHQRGQEDVLERERREVIRNLPEKTVADLKARIDIQAAQGKVEPELLKLWNEVEKTRQELGETETREIDGVTYERHKRAPAGTPWTVAKGILPKEKLSAEQNKLLQYFEAATNSHNQLGSGDEVLVSLSQDLTRRVPLVGNYGLSPEYRAAKNAADDWLLTHIRNVSGAVIGRDEIPQHYPIYFPVPGDEPPDIERKRKARDVKNRSLFDAMGDVQEPAKRFLQRSANEAAALEPLQLTDIKQADRLPAGRRFYSPDGRLRRVPNWWEN